MVGENKLNKERLIFFFDAILAILATILIIEFKIPEIDDPSNENLIKTLVAFLPEFLSYTISFLTIISLWLDHHQMLQRITFINKNFIRLNFLFLIFLSPLLFFTAFAGKYIHHSIAVALLAANYFLMNLSFTFIIAYAIKKGMLVLGKDDPADKRSGLVGILGLILLSISIPTAFFSPIIPFIIFTFVLLAHLLK